MRVLRPHLQAVLDILCLWLVEDMCGEMLTVYFA